MTKGWIRVWRVAQFLDCSRDHVYDMVRDGELVGLKIGAKGLRVSQESLDTFLVKNQVTDPDIHKKF
jgi:excisionase family DNA binding protein